MDKTTTFDNNSIYVMEQIMEPLFTVSKDGSKVEPWLATGDDISADKLTYTIHLRKGVKFSNGQPLTAADVKFSIDENTKTGGDGWGYINSAIDTVTATDPSTVTIKLKYAWAPLLADLSLFANGIIPNNYGGKSKDDFYTAPVGTGPFVWGSWTKGQSVKVTANKAYWGHKPHLDTVTWNVVADANTRKLQLQGGQIDIDDTPDWSSFQSLKGTPGHQRADLQVDLRGVRHPQRAAQAVPGRARAPGDRLRHRPERHHQDGAVRQRHAGGLAALAGDPVLRQEQRRADVRRGEGQAGDGPVLGAEGLLDDDPDRLREPGPGLDRADHAVRAQGASAST